MTAPDMQAMYLFEHYEESGHLLVVTSNPVGLRPSQGDFIVRRKWGTFDAPTICNLRAAREATR